jgi:hypothetical protein
MQTRMLYFVDAGGTIVRAESHISAESALADPTFAYPFSFPDIVGRSLFDFIEGAEVRHIYGLLHQRILNGKGPISFDYRCDSPDVRREMRMSLNFDNHFVRYESIVLKETQRAVSIPLPSPKAALILPICSSCKKYKHPADSQDWKEIDQILNDPSLPGQFNFSHTFCDVCSERLMLEASTN